MSKDQRFSNPVFDEGNRGGTSSPDGTVSYANPMAALDTPGQQQDAVAGSPGAAGAAGSDFSEMKPKIPTVSYREEDFKQPHVFDDVADIGDDGDDLISENHIGEGETHVALMGIVQLIAGGTRADDSDDDSDDEWSVDDQLFAFASASTLQGESCCLFSSKSRLRLLANNIVNHKAFEMFLSGVIALLLFTLIWDFPGSELDAQTRVYFDTIDMMVAVIFTVEAALRILAAGFIQGDHSYLRSGWNKLDFVIVCATWLSLMYGQTQQYLPETGMIAEVTNDESVAMAGLRVLRLLRPLHSLRFFGGLKMILQSLKHALPNVKTVVILLTLFIIVFSSFGLNLFPGALSRRCVDERQYLGNLSMMPDDGCSVVMTCSGQCVEVLNTFDHEDPVRHAGHSPALLSILPLIIRIERGCASSSAPNVVGLCAGAGRRGWLFRF